MKTIESETVREFPNSTIGEVHQTGASIGQRHQGVTVSLRLWEGRGFAEVFGGDYHAEIGLWFEDRVLVDYDGAFDLPAEVATMLREAGYTVEEESGAHIFRSVDPAWPKWGVAGVTQNTQWFDTESEAKGFARKGATV